GAGAGAGAGAAQADKPAAPARRTEATRATYHPLRSCLLIRYSASFFQIFHRDGALMTHQLATKKA
ncbi:hypothetical protein, partial [Nguyenibacter vanlangensis]|uniref:hypothetical protein n=1 Tax=Nguyenibacter vanlangensis TaxID=1216886 RepID=UPI001C400421